MKTLLNKQKIEFDDFSYDLHRFGLFITGYGNVVTDNIESPSESYADLYRLNYVISGAGYYLKGNEVIHIYKNTFVYLPPGAILYPEGLEPVSIMFINFDFQNINAIREFERFMNENYPVFHVEDDNNMLGDLFMTIFKEETFKAPGYAMFANSLLNGLFVQTKRMVQPHDITLISERHESSMALFNLATAYIRGNISNSSLRVTQVAKDIGISEIYLYKLFKRYASQSPSEFIIQYRIILAKNALRNPDYSIKTIAENTGFSNQNYFSNVFKKYTGQSCSEFRRNKYE